MKRVYFQAGVFTILIFLIGIMVGIFIDNYRLESARVSISESDINWNDARLLNSYFQSLGKDYCELALKQNLIYNEKIYSDGREIENKIKTNVFTSDIEQEWRRYNLLQVQFWLNSIELKERCKFNYNNVAHLDRLNALSKAEEINSRIQSSVMLELKERCGDKIMLIPLDADANLIVIDSIIKQYNITEFPTVIVDNQVFQGLTSLEKLQAVVGC